MNEKIRTFIIAAIAAVLLPFVFVAFQGFLARYHATSIIAFENIIGKSEAHFLIIYCYGIIGSALSATLITLPLGMWVTHRPWFVGAIVGVVSILQLAILSQDVATNNYVEYMSLIIFSSLAPEVGRRIKQRIMHDGSRL